jgi:RimJ/RimL family protein N-acetyltransferase
MNADREVRLSLPDGRPLRLRHLVEGDAETSLRYLEAVAGESDYLSFGPGEFDTPIEQQAAYLRGLRSGETGLIVAAVVEGEPGGGLAGLASIRRAPRSRIRHVGELGVSVRKEYWGAGVAKPLCQYVLRESAAIGVSKIELRVRQDNLRAIKLYRSLGFEIEGSPRSAFFANGQFYDEHFMGKVVTGD